jgi:excisionase family DNA binding protein
MSHKRERAPVTEWTSVQEVADRFRLSDAHIRRLLQHNKIPAVKLGKRWLILATDADAFSDQLRAQIEAKAMPRQYPKRTILKPIKVAGRR